MARILSWISKTARIRDGDGLRLEDGAHIRVCAADEDVLDIVCRDKETIAKVAWHLGNRHTPVQVLFGGALRIRYDHVLSDMVNLLGADVVRCHAPFDPEAGAYAESHVTVTVMIVIIRIPKITLMPLNR